MAEENDALLKRVLPHSIEAEQSVIGAMLMDRDAIIAASEIITEEDFYQRQYGVMFQCMVELFNEGQAVDVDEAGRLVVDNGEGKQAVFTGEVTV